ncbi:MAG: hypothetical protein P4L41_10040 [Flavipsychrobacter sp.]|nr:hypothetical protein [Flavipsychrobacter sp.]
MSDLKTFIKGLATKPPLLFPLVALFHILWLLYSLWLARTATPANMEWVQPLWMLAYTTFWIFTCDGRKWAAIGYILLACLNLALYFGLIRYQRDMFTSPIFPTDLLFSFFIFFFYRRLTDGDA